MKYRALVSFVGRISMIKGEVREIQDEALAKSLLQPKFIEKVEEKTKVEEKAKVEEIITEVKEIEKPIVEEKTVIKKKNKKNK